MHFNSRIKLLEEKNCLLEQQCELLKQSFSANAELFHDMNHHLQVIYHMAMQSGNEEILSYVSHISTPINTLTNSTWTGVEIVDAILNYKKTIAAQKGYSMRINAELPYNTGIHSDDYCIILSNLIDNAIEALDRFPQPTDSLFIEISIRRIHQFMMLRISNPCFDSPTRKSGKFTTSKSNKILHGLGLKNVSKIVKKYQGSLDFELKNDIFTVTVLLFFPLEACKQ